MKKLSVIVPVYKAEEYLHQCVDSIINQTYKDLEIILVNDGSPDKSGEICREYAEKDNRIVFVDKQNGGVVSAYTEGFKYATGEFVTFVDSDDWLELDMYEIMMTKMISEQPALDMVVCCFDRVFGSQSIKADCGLYQDSYVVVDQFFHRIAGHSISASKCNKIFKKSILAKVIENLDKSVSSCEDTMVIIPYAKLCNQMFYIDKVLYHYRYNGESITSIPRANYDLDIIKTFNVLKKYDFTPEEMLLVNESMLRLYMKLINLIINSSATKKEKMSYIKRVLDSKEYKYFAQNCDEKFYSKDRKKYKTFWVEKKKALKDASKKSFKKRIVYIAKRLGIVELYHKIKRA